VTIIYPEATPVLGNVKVKAVVDIVDLTAPALATEVNAASSVDMSCALMANGWTPTTSQGKGTRMRRLCSTADVEQLNPAVHTVGTIMWSEGDPQSPDAIISALMVEGAALYFVERLGKDSDTAFAVADKVVTHYLRLGKPYRVYDTTADNGEFYMAAEAVYVNAGPVEGVLAA
jgi:hypothetical protein